MATIHGTNAAEKILPGFVSPTVTGGMPGSAADSIFALGGNDIVRGGLGDDHANLGNGNDRYIWGVADGNDTINGGSGIDTLVVNESGSSGDILILGQTAGKVSVGSADNNTSGATVVNIEHVVLHLSGGGDSVEVKSMAATRVNAVTVDLAAPGSKVADGMHDSVYVEGTDSRDLIWVVETSAGAKVTGLHAETTVVHADGGPNGDALVVKGYAGDDRIDASGMTAKSLALELNGGNGKDTLIGGAGRDFLNGDRGGDVLIGGKGKDFLDGGSGFDRLTGGAGADRFAFQSDLIKNVDTITDFHVGVDKIALNAGIFTLDGSTVSADQFHIGAKAADGNDHIIYNAKTGALFYDADGDSGGAAIHFATLAAHLALTSNDFEVLL